MIDVGCRSLSKLTSSINNTVNTEIEMHRVEIEDHEKERDGYITKLLEDIEKLEAELQIAKNQKEEDAQVRFEEMIVLRLTSL